MTAELLREAAALMRERADTCVDLGSDHEDPWYRTDRPAVMTTTWERFKESAPEDAEHIASWHPIVALTVADWLDAAAEDEQWFARHRHSTFGYTGENPAFAVARAYLGRSS